MTEPIKWEHKAVRAATLEELVVKLDEFGAEGWEVVNFYYGESLGDPGEKEFDGRCYKALMKRAIEEEYDPPYIIDDIFDDEGIFDDD